MPAQKNYGQRRLENSGGVGRRISGGENLGQQQKVEDERNPDVDSRLRVMEIFREFLCETKRDGITCPEGADGREVCIKFHSKGTCTRGCSCSHASLQDQTRADYTRFLDHCRSGYEAIKYSRNRKSSRDGRNFIDGWQVQQQHSWDDRGERHWVGEQQNRGTVKENRQQEVMEVIVEAMGIHPTLHTWSAF